MYSVDFPLEDEHARLLVYFVQKPAFSRSHQSVWWWRADAPRSITVDSRCTEFR